MKLKSTPQSWQRGNFQMWTQKTRFKALAITSEWYEPTCDVDLGLGQGEKVDLVTWKFDSLVIEWHPGTELNFIWMKLFMWQSAPWTSTDHCNNWSTAVQVSNLVKKSNLSSKIYHCRKTSYMLHSTSHTLYGQRSRIKPTPCILMTTNYVQITESTML